MKLTTLILTLSFFLASCGGDANTKPTSQNPALPAATAISIQTEIPFIKDNHVAQNIKDECRIPTQLSEFIKLYAEKKDIKVERKDKVSKDDAGEVLVVEIMDSVSSGNAFIGHNKFTRIKGELYKEGQIIASFEGQRRSGGGYGGGWKGSCSVLGRTVKALGKDVSKFLKVSRMDACIGEG